MNNKKTMKLSDKTEGILNYADLKTFNGRLFYIAVLLFLTAISLICILPVIWVLISGFKSPAEIYSIPPTLLPEHFEFSKLTDMLARANFLKYFYNSVMLIIGCLFCDIVINGLAGYVLSRIRPGGSHIVERLIFGSMLLGGMSMVPLYMTFVDVPLVHINMTGSYMPIWLMAGANAFDVLLFRNFFNGIPKDYLEAAQIDGCSNMGIFGRIIIPMSKPVLMVVSIFCITGTWSNFMWPYLILGNTNKEPVAVMLFSLTSTLRDDETMLLTMISIVPVIIMYAIFSKNIIGGVSMSGIKG